MVMTATAWPAAPGPPPLALPLTHLPMAHHHTARRPWPYPSHTCPPKPGLTVITSTWSTLSRTFSIISAGVCGLSATEGEPPGEGRVR